MDNRTGFERYFLCPFMRFWQDLLDSFNSDGGHILLLVLLFFWFRGDASMEKYAGEVMGALLMYLKMVGSNKTRRDETPEPPKETP